jgi:preprotein translocase subunit YajC
MLRILALLAFSLTSVLLALDESVAGGSGAAGGAAGPGAQAQPSIWPMILLIGGMFLFMWFVIIRPQKKEEKRKKEMLGSTKKGDEVETIGGLRGEVVTVGEQTMEVRLGKDPGVVVVFSRPAVHRNLTQEAAAPAKK